MVVAIAGNAHLEAQQEIRWLVSFRWRAQSSAFKVEEWTHVGFASFDAEPLFDGWSGAQVTTSAVLASLGALDMRPDLQETSVAIALTKTRTLRGSTSTFADLYDATYPPEYAEVFVSAVLGEAGARTTTLVWAGTIESVEETESEVRLTVVDMSRRLLLPITERIKKGDFPNVDSSVEGTRKPLAVGEVRRFVAPFVQDQVYSSLEEPLLAGITTEIEMSSVEAFTDSGTVLIDDEKIDYTGRDTADNKLTGLTRGAYGTADVRHFSGSLVFLANRAAFGAETVDGPILLLSGLELDPQSDVVIEAHSGDGKASFAVDAADVVFAEAAVGGAQLAFRDRYPQNPTQAAEAAWLRVEFDAQDAVKNSNGDWGKAAGADAAFTESNFALIDSGTKLALARTAAIEQVGRAAIQTVYLLVEYGNLSNPRPDGRAVPNEGQNTDVVWIDDGGVEHSLGSLYPEQAPLPEEISDATATVRTRSIDDQHRHAITGSASVAYSAEQVSFDGYATHFGSDQGPTDWMVDFAYGTFTASPTTEQLSDALRNSDDRIRRGNVTGTQTALAFVGDEGLLAMAFQPLYAVSLGAIFAGLDNASVSLADARGATLVSASHNTAVGTPQAEYASGDLGGLTFGRLAPGILRLSSTVYMPTQRYGWIHQLLPVTIATDPEPPRPVSVLHARDVTGLTAAENQRWLDATGGARPAWNRLDSGGAHDTAAKVEFAAPTGPATVSRLCLVWNTADLSAPAAFHLRIGGVLVHTFTYPGEILDVSASGYSIADLDGAIVRPSSTNGASSWRCYWMRLCVEFEGQLEAEELSAIRYSSLKAFDITPYVNLQDWQSLVQGTAGTRAIVVRSPDSTGAYSTEPLNNDSLWILRASLLLAAAPPVTSIANRISVSFRGIYGLTSAGVPSRASGDVLVELLRGADKLAIGGDDYWADGGFVAVDDFHSDMSGPPELANGVVVADDAAAVLVSLARESRRSLSWERGRLRLRALLSSGWAAAARTFANADLIEAVRTVRRPADTIINELLVQYDQNFVEGGYDGEELREPAASQAKFGRRRDEQVSMTFDNTNRVDAASVQQGQASDFADLLQSYYSDVGVLVYWTTALNGLDLELGDIVAFATTAFSATKVEISGISIKPGGADTLDTIAFEGIVRVP